MFWRKKKEREPHLGAVSADKTSGRNLEETFSSKGHSSLLTEQGTQNPFDELIGKYQKNELKLTDGIEIEFEEIDQTCWHMYFDTCVVQVIVDKYRGLIFNIVLEDGDFITFGMAQGDVVFTIYDGKLNDRQLVQACVIELLMRYFMENSSSFSMKNLGNYAGIRGLD